MSKKVILGVISPFVIILGAVFYFHHQPNNDSKPSSIRVVTSLNFYGEVATAVAGKHGQVTSIINSAATDPHDFKATTKEAKEVSQANVIITNGLGYDGWLTKLVKSAGKEKQQIVVGTTVAHKQMGANEHIWYQPQTMAKLANILAQRFGQLDPAHKTEFKQNAQAYQKKLKKLDATIQASKQRVQATNNRVDVSEPVFNYALANLGYQINNSHFAKAVEDGTDPSPKDIQEMKADMQNHRIAFFVNNPQESSPVVKNLLKTAKQNNIPVLNITETKPDGKTYVQWMLDQYQDLEKIQEKE